MDIESRSTILKHTRPCTYTRLRCADTECSSTSSAENTRYSRSCIGLVSRSSLVESYVRLQAHLSEPSPPVCGALGDDTDADARSVRT